MTTTDFSTSITVDQSPEATFNAITNVRGWWSEEIEGGTAKINDIFEYHFEDVHRCKVQLIEVIPNKRVVWKILENYFKFTEDETEWTGTTVHFEISESDNKTQVHFVHKGLVPEYECFNICKDAWSNYLHNSLYSLIATGKGMPNANGSPRTENEKKLTATNFTTSITVDKTATEVFNAINNISGWWQGEIIGNSTQLNDEFSYRMNDIHYSKQQVIELVTNEKIVWLVTDSNLSSFDDKSEWTGTKIIFEISEVNNQTQVCFTHNGLVPQFQCYGDCSWAWGQLVQESLFSFINTGKGVNVFG
ncbi:MAG: SRPBCC family protein [Bacteroidota bacterium]